MRSILAWLGTGLALVAGCATSADVTKAVDAAKGELRQESQAEFAKVRAEVKAAQEGQAVVKKDLAAQKQSTDSAVADLKAQIGREVGAISTRLGEIQKTLEATSKQMKEVSEQTIGIASQVIQVREDYVNTLKWEAEVLNQRLTNLRRVIKDMGAGGGEGAVAPGGVAPAESGRK